MSSKKVMYCCECRERTVHEFVSKETVGDGTGPCRIVLAVFSLGLSEWGPSVTRYYQCTKCGKIKSE